MGDVSSDGPRLKAICVYPVKGCRPLSVTKWPVGPKGLLYDRHFSVINTTGRCFDSEKEPKLCLVETQVDLEQQTLTLSFPGFGSIVVDLEEKETKGPVPDASCVAKIGGERVLGQDCGEQAALWLQDVFNQEGLRLIRQHKNDERVSKAKLPISITYYTHFLVVNYRSILKLKQDLEEMDYTLTYDADELVRRMRGNLIIDGVEPYEEETWDTFQIGKLPLKYEGNCPRCKVICVDTEIGELSKEPIRALGVLRGPTKPFGVLAAIRNYSDPPTEICVGDLVSLN